MQKVKFIVVFTLSVFWVSPGMADDIDDIKELIIETYDKVWSDLDVNVIDKFHTKDYTMLNDGEDVWSNFDVVLYLKRAKNVISKTFQRVNRFEFIEHKIHGDVAWVTFYNIAETSDATSRVNETKFLESGFFVKVDGRWKFQLLHSTQVRNP